MLVEEIATVVHVDGALADVESLVKSSCHGCKQQDSCGSGQVAKAFPSRRLQLRVTHHYNDLRVGEEVVVGLQQNSLLSSAAIVYLLPLLFIIVAGGFAQSLMVEQWQMAEPWALLVTAISGVCGWLLARYHQQQHLVKQGLQARIVRRCSQAVVVEPYRNIDLIN
ncbi:SoxR reducing system RseC family protein [Thalassotalea maritima]|uniref:SoxR reducing system RseC family protein n=1 Tax=Thalassotalea maritima TaxID=3242416 RepID=UPI003529D20B